MERMQAAVIAACAVSILSGILQLLRPNEKFDRQLRLLTAGMMVLSILTPFMQGVWNLTPDWSILTDMPAYEESDLAKQVQQQTTAQVQQNLEQTLSAELLAHGADVTDLSVVIHISEEDRIDISSVTVQSNTPQIVRQVLQAYLGEEVEIVVESNQGTLAE